MGLGGGVSVAHEDPKLLGAFYALAAAHPRRRFLVTSGDRLHQPASGPYPIAPEGSSNHERWAYHRLLDEAVDVTVDGQPIGLAIPGGELAGYDLHVAVPGDPVHLTRLEVSG